jgi:enoyl-CoA hydratase/carnithine racemase
MDEATARLTVDEQEPGYWRVTLNYPPINTIDDLMYDEVFDLVQAIDAEPGLKVVTFESADPDYFLAHYGVGSPRAGSARRAGVTPRSCWLTATSSASP